MLMVNTILIEDFDIIENDENKEYGYSFIYKGTGYSDRPGYSKNKEYYGWKCETYKERICFNSGNYSDIVSEFCENNTNYSYGVAETLKEALADHFEWWMQDNDKIPDADTLQVALMTDEELANLFKTGFSEERLYIRQADEAYLVTIYNESVTSEPADANSDISEQFIYLTSGDLTRSFDKLLKKYEGRWYRIQDISGEDIISGVLDPDDIYSICDTVGEERPPIKKAGNIPGLFFIYYNDGSGYAEYMNKRIAQVDQATREYKINEKDASWIYEPFDISATYISAVENYIRSNLLV